MAETLANILIVDDDSCLRTALALILTACGFRVRAAADGFSALREIARGLPDILVSDLNMPFMSGFELLSVVRRRFPLVRVIAMSASYSGTEVPSGVAADAFYAKGNSSVAPLLDILNAMSDGKRVYPRKPSAPIWVTKGPHQGGARCVFLSCPECLRTFPHLLVDARRASENALCIHCSSAVKLFVVESPARREMPASLGLESPLAV